MSPNDDVSEAKRRIRSDMRARRRALAPAARELAAQRLQEALEPSLSKAAVVAAFMPFDGELDPRRAIDAWWTAGRRLCLPRVEGERMVFAETSGWTELVRGALGIEEPTTDGIALEAIDVVLVPGVAFDSSGARLGLGKGYYDRVIAQARADGEKKGGDKVPLFVGIAYQWQVINSVPTSSFDQHVDRVVAV